MKKYLMKTSSYTPYEFSVEDGEKQRTLDWCIEKAEDVEGLAHLLNVNEVDYKEVDEAISDQDQEGCEIYDCEWSNAIIFLCHDGQCWLVYDALGHNGGKYYTIESVNCRIQRLMEDYTKLKESGVYSAESRGETFYVVKQPDCSVSVHRDDEDLINFFLYVPNGPMLLGDGDMHDFYDAPAVNNLKKLPDDHPKTKAYNLINNVEAA